jgi:hypothetical protein
VNLKCKTRTKPQREAVNAQPDNAFQTVDVDLAAIGIRDDDLSLDDFKVAPYGDNQLFSHTANVADVLKTHSVQVFGHGDNLADESSPEVKDVEEEDFARDVEQTERMKRSVFTASINLRDDLDGIGGGLAESAPLDAGRQIQTESKLENKDKIEHKPMRRQESAIISDKHAFSIMTSQAASTVGRRKTWARKTSIRDERSLPRCIEESAKTSVEEHKEQAEPMMSPEITGIAKVLAPQLA